MTKKKEETALKYMTGTEGNPDYLIIADSSGRYLGIKPIIAVPNNGTVLGVRVRSCRKKSDIDLSDFDDFDEKKTHGTAFPELTFDRTDEARAATEIVMFVPRYLYQEGAVIEALGVCAIPEKLARFLRQRVPVESLLVPEKVIAKFITDKMKALIEQSGPQFLDEALDAKERVMYLPEMVARLNKPKTATNQKADKAGLKLLEGGKED